MNELANFAIVNRTPNPDAGSFVEQAGDVPARPLIPFQAPPVPLLSEGDSVGVESTNDHVFEALLYVEGEIFPFDSAGGDVSIPEEAFEFSVGPLSENGSSGFAGLFVTDPLENSNFGFVELTRGGITVGDVGVQAFNGASAPIPPARMGLGAGDTVIRDYGAVRAANDNLDEVIDCAPARLMPPPAAAARPAGRWRSGSRGSARH